MGEAGQAADPPHLPGRESEGPAATWEEVASAGGTPEEAEEEEEAGEAEEEETKGAAPATWSP